MDSYFASPQRPNSATARQSYTSTSSRSTQITQLTDIWDDDLPLSAVYNPSRYNSAKMQQEQKVIDDSQSRPDYQRYSTHTTLPDDHSPGKQVKTRLFGPRPGLRDRLESTGASSRPYSYHGSPNQTPTPYDIPHRWTGGHTQAMQVETLQSAVTDLGMEEKVESVDQFPEAGSSTPSTIEDIYRDDNAAPSRSTPRITSSPSIVALRNNGRIRNRISTLELTTAGSPPPTPKQQSTWSREWKRTEDFPARPLSMPEQSSSPVGVRVNAKPVNHEHRPTSPSPASPIKSLQSRSTHERTESRQRSEHSTSSRLFPARSKRSTRTTHSRISPCIASPVETFESFRVESFYGSSARSPTLEDEQATSTTSYTSHNVALQAKRDTKEIQVQMEEGQALPTTSPLNIRKQSAKMSTSSMREALGAFNVDLNSFQGEPTTGESITTRTNQSCPQTFENTLQTPVKTTVDDGTTISPSNFSTSKPLPKKARVPPPVLSPNTEASLAFESFASSQTSKPSDHVYQTAEQIPPLNSAVLSEKGAASPYQKEKELPKPPSTQSHQSRLGLGAGPAGPSGQRIGSGRTGMRGEMSSTYQSPNKDKPLPVIYPNTDGPKSKSQQSAHGYRPPQRTWASDELVIPVSPPRTDPRHDRHLDTPRKQDRSPLGFKKSPNGRSPLKEIMGKLQDVGKKVKREVGKRRHNHPQDRGTPVDSSLAISSPFRFQGSHMLSTTTSPHDDVFSSRPIPTSPCTPKHGTVEVQHGLGDQVGVAKSMHSDSSWGDRASSKPSLFDRMGDAEMDAWDEPTDSLEDDVPLRESTGYYLLPSPCSTDESQGQWVPAQVSLHPGKLTIARTISNSLLQTCIETLDLRDCTDITSYKGEEASRRGVPTLPNREEADTDTVQMNFRSSPKRYLAFDDLASRLGWISALWDAILASKNISATGGLMGEQQRRKESFASPDLGRKGSSYFPWTNGVPSGGPLVIRNGPLTPSSFNSYRMASNPLRTDSPGAPESPLKFEDQEMLARSRSERRYSAYSGIGSGGGGGVKPSLSLVRGPGGQIKPANGPSNLSRRSSSVKTTTTAELETGIPSVSSHLSQDEDHSNDAGSLEKDSSISRSSEADECNEIDGTRRPVIAVAPELSGPETSNSRELPRPGRPLPKPRMPALLGPRPSPAAGTSVTAVPTLQHGPGEVRLDANDVLPRPTTTSEDVNPMKNGEEPLPNNASPPPKALVLPETIEANATGSDTESPDVLPDYATEVSPDSLGGLLVSENKSGDATVDTHSSPISDAKGFTNEHPETISSRNDSDLGVPQEDPPFEPEIGAPDEVTGAESKPILALPEIVTEKLDGMHVDIKDILNSIHLATLAVPQAPVLAPSVDLEQVHSKLDRLLVSLSPPAKEEENKSVNSSDHEDSNKGEPDEPAAAELPKVAVLSASLDKQPESEKKDTGDTSETVPADTSKGAQEELAIKVKEILSVVEDLKNARATQTQQTGDVAKYLADLNQWLEKFVVGSGSEMQAMTGKLDRLVKELAPESEPGLDGAAVTPAAGVAALVNQMHGLMLEQKKRGEEDKSTADRVDTLVNTMVDDRSRWSESLEKIRKQNEDLLRAVATDLTSEIRGERLRFVEAMREATSVNVSSHIDEFKNMLNTEVSKTMRELTEMREQKRALELQISDYFALMAKSKGSDPSTPKASMAIPAPAAAVAGLKSATPRSPLPLPPQVAARPLP